MKHLPNQSTKDFTFLKLRFFFFVFTTIALCFSSTTYGQVALVNPPKGGFDIDGGLKANTPTANIGDWVHGPGGTGDSVLRYNGTAFVAATTGRAIDPYTNNDNVFTNGSKFNDVIGDLRWFTNSAPDKNDINTGLYHVSTNTVNGDQWLFIAGDRFSTNGTSYIDFELLQGSITVNGNGTFTGSGLAGGRTVNDINVSMEYTNGGTKPLVVIYRWKAKAGGGYAWDSTGSALTTDAFAETNRTGPTDVPFGAFGSTQYLQYAFVEAGINITQMLSSGGNCEGLSIHTLWIKTKASNSTTAALKDYIDPISVNFTFGEVTLVDPADCCVNTAAFALQGSPAGGTYSGPGVSGSNFDPAVAGVGTHTIQYQVNLGIGCVKSKSISIEVKALPTGSIAGTNAVCLGDASPFVVITGAGGTKPYTFSYTLNGGSTQNRSTTGTNDTVKIAVPTGASGILTYALTGVSDANCSNTASGNVVVTVNALPTISGLAVGDICTGESSASLTYTATGEGADQYKIVWASGPGSMANFAALPASPISIPGTGSLTAGTYNGTIYVKNSTTGCISGGDPVSLTVNDNTLVPDAVYVAPATCTETTYSVRVNSPANGKYTLTQPGETAKEFVYPTDGNDVLFTGLIMGLGYSVVYENTSGCVTPPATCGIEATPNATPSAKVSSQTILVAAEKASVVAYPNPFGDKVRFVVTSEITGRGNLEVFNMLGQKVKTVYEGTIAIGSQTFELRLPAQQLSNLVYVLRIGDKRMTGKLIHLR